MPVRTYLTWLHLTHWRQSSLPLVAVAAVGGGEEEGVAVVFQLVAVVLIQVEGVALEELEQSQVAAAEAAVFPSEVFHHWLLARASQPADQVSACYFPAQTEQLKAQGRHCTSDHRQRLHTVTDHKTDW